MVAIMTIQVKSINLPTRIISDCLTKPVEYTIAFGGVPTGIIKAQDAPRPIIIAKPSGGIFNACAIEIKIGTSKAALAVFEVNSVKQTIKAATINAIT